MQSTQRKLTTIGLLTTLIATALTIAAQPVAAANPVMEFGINIGGIDHMTNTGIKPNYATVWVGSWTIDNWNHVDSALATMNSKGVTPVIQFYYWGNDLNRNCWDNGCWSGVHGEWKSQSGWDKLAQQTVSHLHSKMGGKKVILVIETEFNKGDMGSSETLDGGLAGKAWYLRNNYPGAVVAMGFGNWGYTSWGVFDRAMAASHEGGLQGMRGSTQDSWSSYTNLPSSLIKGAQELKNRFGKPVIIHDIAASTYPEPGWLGAQNTVIKSLFSRIGELESAGVHALIYRGDKDNPDATTAEYFGQAERHFGLRWYSNGTAKPAFNAWKNGILAERAGTTSSGPAPAPSTSTNTPMFAREAESFTTKTTGAVSYRSSASGGKAWNLWSNGEISDWVNMGTGTYEVKVRAQGTSAQGVRAHMDIWAGGQRIGAADVASGYWSDHTAKVTITNADWKQVRIVYTNDLKTSSEDRNLYLDRVEIRRV